MRFSRVRGGWRIGATFFDDARVAGAGEPEPRGVVDRLADLANPGLDVARVHPAIVAFFEDTASLELLIRSHWRGPFAVLWRLARPILGWIGQFVLPLRDARIATRAHALDPARDGRERPRAIVRTYAGGDVMQAVAYATWERAGARYMSAAFPLPGGHVAGFLRLDAIGEDSDGRLAVALTSRRRATGRDSGVWLVLGRLAIPSPFGETLSLWAAGTSCVPAELRDDPLGSATIVGRHVQTLFGVRFVTHHYYFRPDRGQRSGPRDDRALPPRT